MRLTLDDLSHMRAVAARVDIDDTPFASGGPVHAGAVGEVCDVDYVAELAYVDFGAGALACKADELVPAR